MPNKSEELEEQKVIPYGFDDEEINSTLAELNRTSHAMVMKYKKQIMVLKVLLVLSAILLTVMLEYMMFVSLWYREPIFKFVMIFTPALAGSIGYLAADIIDRTFDLKYGLFNNEFQFAYENKYIYKFKGVFQSVHSDEKLWTNIIAGNYIWRVRSKVQDLKVFEGKMVMLLLTRVFYDDDVDYECIYIKEV